MKPVELLFRPVDNQRLANLCGVLDEHLRQIDKDDFEITAVILEVRRE